MTTSKKLVLGTQRALEKAIQEHKAKGWEVEHTEVKPRGATKWFTYIAYFKRETE